LAEARGRFQRHRAQPGATVGSLPSLLAHRQPFAARPQGRYFSPTAEAAAAIRLRVVGSDFRVMPTRPAAIEPGETVSQFAALGCVAIQAERPHALSIAVRG